jgi:hypothetical protein
MTKRISALVRDSAARMDARREQMPQEPPDFHS